MKLYLLIGGIGSGKSSVQEMLRNLGAVCLDLDKMGHEVLNETDVRNALIDRFGTGILEANGALANRAINRRLLAKQAFRDTQATCDLEDIVQPAIVARALKNLDYLDGAGIPIVVIEVSSYQGPHTRFAELDKRAQGIIAVVAPAELRVQRAVTQGFEEQDVRNRLARQVSDEQRVSWADYVIDNRGTLEQLQSQVQKLWAHIKPAGEGLYVDALK